MEQFPTQEEARKKGCPKSAFLGLCEDGFVKGVPKGNYTKGKLNKAYSVKAAKLLQSKNFESITSKELWSEVMAGEIKTPNSQMEVVLSLAKNNLLNI